MRRTRRGRAEREGGGGGGGSTARHVARETLWTLNRLQGTAITIVRTWRAHHDAISSLQSIARQAA